MPFPPIRELPEVAHTDKLADVLWLSEASEKLFKWFLGVNLFTGMCSQILCKSLVFNVTIFE